MLRRSSERERLHTQRRFESALMGSTVRAIRGALDESSSSALLFYLKFASPISAEKIHERLYGILDSGAIVLEKRIVAELYGRFNFHYSERNGFDFERMLAEGRARL
jgi:hypothetical protein